MIILFSRSFIHTCLVIPVLIILIWNPHEILFDSWTYCYFLNHVNRALCIDEHSITFNWTDKMRHLNMYCYITHWIQQVPFNVFYSLTVAPHSESLIHKAPTRGFGIHYRRDGGENFWLSGVILNQKENSLYACPLTHSTWLVCMSSCFVICIKQLFNNIRTTCVRIKHLSIQITFI